MNNEQQSTIRSLSPHNLRFVLFHANHDNTVPQGLHVSSSIVQPRAEEIEGTRSSHKRVIVHKPRLVPTHKHAAANPIPPT